MQGSSGLRSAPGRPVGCCSVSRWAYRYAQTPANCPRALRKPAASTTTRLTKETFMPEMTDAYQWHGRTIVGSDGEKIGKITDIYEDPETGKPEWATVSSGLFGTKSNFVPLAGASPDGEDVRADVTKDQVKDAPGVENDGDLSEPEERRLFEHYGVPYTSQGTTTAEGAPNGGANAGGTDDALVTDRAPQGYDTSGPNTDDAM